MQGRQTGRKRRKKEREAVTVALVGSSQDFGRPIPLVLLESRGVPSPQAQKASLILAVTFEARRLTAK